VDEIPEGPTPEQPRYDPSPEAQRFQLCVALKKARIDRRMTQMQVARELEWSPSKIIRIEKGVNGISIVDLRALFNLYGIEDSTIRSDLEDMARASKNQTWTQFRDVYSKVALTVFGMESLASTIYKYEPILIPGLLQTQDYARALLTGFGHDTETIDRMVDARLERQELLEQPVSPRLMFVVGEAAVSSLVGGPRIMDRQFERLLELNARSNIDLRLLPFQVGSHPRMGSAFTIFEFAEPGITDLVYLEGAFDEMIMRDDPEMIAAFQGDFYHIQSLCLPKDELGAILESVRGRFP
jgi:transcriptional regulator with XRE-family HTH domain